MRRGLLSLLPALLLVPSLAAQGYQGSLKVNVLGAPDQAMTWKFRDNRSVASFSVMTPQSESIDVLYHIDNAARTNTTLFTLPGMVGGESKGLKIVRDLPLAATATATAAAKAPPAKPRKLGTSQTIAGLPCDDYELTDSARTHACISDALGAFVYPAAPLGNITAPMNLGTALPAGAVAAGGRTVIPISGGMIGFTTSDATPPAGAVTSLRSPAATADGASAMGTAMTTRAPAAPAWSRALAGLGFPLKVVTASGTTLMEVTSGNREPVNAEAFEIPDGYTELRSSGARPGAVVGGAVRGGGL